MLLIHATTRMKDKNLNICEGILNESVPDDPISICAEATLDFTEGKYGVVLTKYCDVLS